MNELLKNKDILPQLCEKLYFQEILARENLNARAQLPFAILVALSGFVGFLLQNLERERAGLALWAFGFFVFFAIGFLFLAASYFLKAVSGHEYQFIAAGNFWIDHLDKCHAKYEEFEGGAVIAQAAFEENLMKEYGEKGYVNSNINDDRSLSLHISMQMLIKAMFYTGVASIIFYFGALDKSNYSKAYDVKIVNQVKMEK